MRTALFIFTICVLQPAAHSQLADLSPAWLGSNAYSSGRADVFSVRNNQASLASLERFSAGVYTERKFLMKELNLSELSLAIPTSSGNFGFNALTSGSSVYSETQLGLAYARKLGDKLSVGVQFNYFMVKIAGYGNAPSINFDLAVLSRVTDKLQAGLHVYNPLRSKLSRGENERLPMIWSAGIGYAPSAGLLISVEIEKREDHDPGVNINLQYDPDDKIELRTGISASNSSIYFGAGYCLHAFRVLVIANYHQQLGITPGLLLIYASPKIKAK